MGRLGEFQEAPRFGRRAFLFVGVSERPRPTLSP